MSGIVKLTGKIIFDPKDVTKKHKNQASWKYVAMVLFDDDTCKYYSWFFKKRFNLTLEEPIRKSHVTFINDSFFDLSNKGEKTKEQVVSNWETLKNKWNGKKIDVWFNLNPDTNSLTREEIEFWEETGSVDLGSLSDDKSTMHWWFIVPHDKRDELQSIRSEIGLEKPFFGMHMTIGRVVDSRSDNDNDSKGLNIKEMRRYHSRYIHLLKLEGLF
jgi:hypothetical protein